MRERWDQNILFLLSSFLLNSVNDLISHSYFEEVRDEELETDSTNIIDTQVSEKWWEMRRRMKREERWERKIRWDMRWDDEEWKEWEMMKSNVMRWDETWDNDEMLKRNEMRWEMRWDEMKNEMRERLGRWEVRREMRWWWDVEK